MSFLEGRDSSLRLLSVLCTHSAKYYSMEIPVSASESRIRVYYEQNDPFKDITYSVGVVCCRAAQLIRF